MPRWQADIRVALRPGIADPEGTTVGDALRALGYGTVGAVRFGKVISVEFGAADAAEAEELVGDMCRRLLANPVMELAAWDVRPALAAEVGS